MLKIIFSFLLYTAYLLGSENSVFISEDKIVQSNKNEHSVEKSKNTDSLPQKKENIFKLMFADSGTRSNWTDGMNYCKELKLDGYNNWILPTRKELLSILREGHNSFHDEYWTRTTFQSDNRFAWNANTKNTGWYEKNGQCNVICIRYDDPNQLENGCNNGNPDNCLVLADHYNRNNEFIKSLELYKKACSLDQPSACFKAGVLYQEGKGVIQDYIQASIYYKKACDNNYKEGCTALSKMYQNGQGVEQNIYNSKHYFLLGIEDENGDYSQISEPVIPEFRTITEKMQWIAAQKKKIDQKYALLEEKMAFCGKNLIVTIKDTQTTIDQKFKDADKNFKQYRNDKIIFEALYSDYKQELDYIGFKPNEPFSQLDKFANIYLRSDYKQNFEYMIAWEFNLGNVDSYKNYLEYAYKNIDRLKFERKFGIFKKDYSEEKFSPAERALVKKLMQNQSRAKQLELVKKYFKEYY